MKDEDTKAHKNTYFFELMQSASPIARRCIVEAYMFAIFHRAASLPSQVSYAILAEESQVRIRYVLLTLHVTVINLPFWIYAPDCDVTPPPKKPRQ